MVFGLLAEVEREVGVFALFVETERDVLDLLLLVLLEVPLDERVFLVFPDVFWGLLAAVLRAIAKILSFPWSLDYSMWAACAAQTCEPNSPLNCITIEVDCLQLLSQTITTPKKCVFDLRKRTKLI